MMNSSIRLTSKLRLPLAIFLLASLVACSGGGSNKVNNQNPGPGSGWQQGVFNDLDTYFARCAAPRSGTDPWTGNPFPDVQGTTLDENNFLRSFSNYAYLWYDEITDRDPGLYNDTLAYFDLLKTEATTPSGAPKDKFHFTYDSEEWFQLSQAGVSAGYGITWAFISNTPPRELLIAYTEPNSPATNIAVPLERGARILAVNGVDINDNTQPGIDTLNAGIQPSSAGEQHTFTVLDLGAETSRDVTLTSANVTATHVQNTQVISTITGEVGYMTFNDHLAPAEQQLIDAVNQLSAHNGGQGIDDLVLDLRYNGGGLLDIASQLAYMIAGPVPTAGQTFDDLQFNDKHPTTDPITGQPLAPTPFHTETLGFSAAAGQALPSLDLPRVFILTGPGTCSASEHIINGLRGVGVEVIQIGSTTCGKPYGFYPIDNCGTTYFTIQFRGVNAVGFGDFSDGFSPSSNPTNLAEVPGCPVPDDFTKQLGDQTEGRLSAALAYRDSQLCPAPATAAAPGSLSKTGLPLNAVDAEVLKSPYLMNLIMQPWRKQ